MTEKRVHARVRRRLLVKFGERELVSSGFTGDLSRGGMFVVSPQQFATNTRLHLQLFVSSTRFIFFEGQVRRVKSAPAPLASHVRAGFAVRFPTPGELLADALHEGCARAEVTFTEAEELRAFFLNELKRRVVTVVTADPVVPGGTARLELDVAYAGKQFSFDCTVMRVQPSPTKTSSAVELMLDPIQVSTALAPFLV